MFDKLFYSSLSVLTASVVFNFVYITYVKEKPYLTIQTGIQNYVVSEQWVSELHDYIAAYLPQWINDTYSETVGQCAAVCTADGNGDYSTIEYADVGCRTFPVLINDPPITNEKLALMTYAQATIPCFLTLSQSVIPGANLGIFTKSKIPKGMIFGPYTGIIRSAYGEEGDLARNGGYAWRINTEDENGEEDDFYVDGVEETNSNWLRWVNSARFEEEQNMFTLMFNNSVYYIAYKDVEPNTELMVWYGKAYAAWLGIETIEGSDHDWETDFAPRNSIVLCDSCERSRPKASEDSVVVDDPGTVSMSDIVEPEHVAGMSDDMPAEDEHFYSGHMNDSVQTAEENEDEEVVAAGSDAEILFSA